MPFTPYLSFPGTAEDVLNFYHAALGGETEISRYGDSPGAAEVPPDWASKIIFSRLTAPSGTICIMDAPPERAGQAGNTNVLLAIELKDRTQAAPIFEKLSAGGTVLMPLGATFWSPLFGMVLDKFGTKWMVSCA